MTDPTDTVPTMNHSEGSRVVYVPRSLFVLVLGSLFGTCGQYLGISVSRRRFRSARSPWVSPFRQTICSVCLMISVSVRTPCLSDRLPAGSPADS